MNNRSHKLDHSYQIAQREKFLWVAMSLNTNVEKGTVNTFTVCLIELIQVVSFIKNISLALLWWMI